MANGNFGGGNGTAASPYLVEDAADLDAIRNHSGNKHFKQVADIDLSSYLNFVPIPSQYLSISSYDGQGFKILNLRMVYPSISSALALFTDATLNVNRMNIINCYIHGQNYVAGIVGGNGNSGKIIKDCYVEGTVIGNTAIGMICGNSDHITIENCIVKGTLRGAGQVGGIIGRPQSNMKTKNCVSLVDRYERVASSSQTTFGDIAGDPGNVYNNVQNCISIDTIQFVQL